MNEFKEIKEEKPKKKKGWVSRYITGPAKDVLSGDFLGRGSVFSNLGFLLYITVIMLFYIGYGYYVDNTLRRSVDEEKKGAELYSELQSVKERLNQLSLQSTVAESVREMGLFEAKDPPKVIEVEKGFFEEKEN
jgi:hypothetical protein